MFCGVPYLIGYLMLSYAHYSATATVFNAVLFSGRALAGFGMGWASAVSPVSVRHTAITGLTTHINFS